MGDRAASSAHDDHLTKGSNWPDPEREGGRIRLRLGSVPASGPGLEPDGDQDLRQVGTPGDQGQVRPTLPRAQLRAAAQSPAQEALQRPRALPVGRNNLAACLTLAGERMHQE